MNWEGDLIQRGDRNGYVFVFADDTRVVNPHRARNARRPWIWEDWQ